MLRGRDFDEAFCAEEIVLSHLSSLGQHLPGVGPTDQEDQHMGWIMGAPAVPLGIMGAPTKSDSCRSRTKPLVAGVLRHDHNQRGTHGSDGIVNYEPRS